MRYLALLISFVLVGISSADAQSERVTSNWLLTASPTEIMHRIERMHWQSPAEASASINDVSAASPTVLALEHWRDVVDRIVMGIADRDDTTMISAFRLAEHLATAHGMGLVDDDDLARVANAIAQRADSADRNVAWRIAIYLQAQDAAIAASFDELLVAGACLRLLRPDAHHLDIRNAATLASAAWRAGISLGPQQQALITTLAAIAENPRLDRRKRAPAITALTHAPAERAQTILIRIAIRDTDKHHRSTAIGALWERTKSRHDLGLIDRASGDVVEALAHAARDPEPNVVAAATIAARELFDYGLTDNQRRQIATAMLANTRVPDRAVSIHAHAIATVAVGLTDFIPRYETYLATTARPHLKPGDAQYYLGIIRGRNTRFSAPTTDP